ncbi:MAG: hypothetical protein C0485_18765 [Pirellula sp.]|nr:hypothetical protein [Pirellula sp.]
MNTRMRPLGSEFGSLWAALFAFTPFSAGLLDTSRAAGARVILREDFESDQPDAQPASADHYQIGYVSFVNPATEPGRIVVSGGTFADPFGPGNQSLVIHNPNSATQSRIAWTSIFGDDPTAFRNGVIEFDAWMEKPLPVLGAPGGKFWSFFEVRTGFGGPNRSEVTSVGDVTAWPNFRIQNIFGDPEPRDQIVDAGGRYSIGFEPTFTDGSDDLFGPDRSFHVAIEIDDGDGTPTTERYGIKINDEPITWSQTGESSNYWVPGSPGVNILAFYSDASAFFSGGASNAYIDNLVVTNNDLPPLGNGDYDGDLDVDGTDFLVWQRTFADSPPAGTGADGDGDGQIGAGDLAVWRESFGSTAARPTNSVVPEPTSALSMAFVLTAISAARRSRRVNWCAGAPFASKRPRRTTAASASVARSRKRSTRSGNRRRALVLSA